MFGMLLVVLLVAAGCGSSSDKDTNSGQESSQESSQGAGQGTQEKKVLKIAFNPGPYRDMFENGARPVLESMGYEIVIREFTEGIQPNVAVARGELDANTHQHIMYMESINQREKLNNVALIEQPTPPMGLYSKKIDSLDQLKKGAKVNVPNEPPNLLRALTVLQDAGLIKIKDNIDPLQTSLNDILENPLDLDFIMTDPAQGPRALDDVDLVAIQGNYAVANNIKLSSALKLENLKPPFVVVITVDGDRVNEQFAKDLIAAYESDTFVNYVNSNPDYEGYYKPDYFNK
jgi:D-methionine transport system substrate-binding protein